MSWYIFGKRPAREAAELPHVAPQAQQNTNVQTQALLTDKEKWQRSKQRWNADIKPTDEAFKIKNDHFVEQLRTKSPEAVVKTHFSNHEVRKFLSGYVDKKRFKAIHTQQTVETNRYKTLLESEEYKDVQERNTPLALKLTMMYFGLPVAPMTFTDPLQTSGESVFGNLVFSTGLNEDEDDAEDEDLSFVPEEMRPLRFLNYYDKRGYGKDNSHMNPEKTYELFYGIPMVVPTHELMGRMRLRGAGTNDASDDEDSVMDNMSDEVLNIATNSVTGSTKVASINPNLSVREDKGDTSTGQEVYLWGLSGRTVFSYFDPRSFFSAIDRTLGLRRRSDDVTSIGITMSLLSHPKGERGPCVVLASDQCFLGRSEEDELNFYKTWLETVQYFDDQLEDGHALDICVAQISQDIHFSGAQKDLVYRPSVKDAKLVSFSLSGDKNGALAYLYMDADISSDVAAVHYQEWFKSLWRTLSRPTEEQLKTYRIGSNQVLPPQSCLMSIAYADAGDDERHHWLSDLGPTREAWEWFTNAYLVGGHRDFVLKASPMTGSRASLNVYRAPNEMAFPATRADQSARVTDFHGPEPRCYWGHHNLTDDAIAFQETDRPQSQSATRRPLALDPLGRPVNGAQLDDFAKGKAFREWSYAHPLSIHMQGQYPSIPINAPPLETILKTPGVNGLPSNSVPVMSTQVLTPTEQRQLQETVFELRSLALNRAQPCPFRPCRKHFAIDDAGRKLFRDHIQNTHIDKKCPLCGDKMFGYYDEQTKQQHFYEKHVYYFSHKDDLYLNTIFEVPSKELTHDRERQWNFCARCGRDHNQLNVNGDRAQHDNMCFPGVTEVEAQSNYCVDCGANASGAATHLCILDPNADPDTTPVHCKKCALPTHKLARSYAEKHLARCRGSHSDTARWCPWCGQNLTIYSRAQSYKHLDDCSYKPPTGEGPINTTTGEASESPNDGRETRYWEKQFHFTRDGQRNIIQIPAQCRVKGCTKSNLQELHADALLDHYSTEAHAKATDRLRFCPICNIDFVQREWVKKQQKVDHFQDHIDEREKRIRLDLEIAKATNKLDEVTLAKVNLRNEDEFASKSNDAGQHQAEGRALALQLVNLERLLSSQRRADHTAEQSENVRRERLESLETKFNTLMDAFKDSSAHDRNAKRLRNATPTTGISGASSSKKRKTATIAEPIEPSEPRTPLDNPSTSEGSWATTPSTASSGAIMTPSDDTGPIGSLGSEPPSVASTKTLAPLAPPQIQSPVRPVTEAQSRNTPMAPKTPEKQSVRSSLATATIYPETKPTKPKTSVQSGGSTTTRSRARRARIAYAGQDKQSIPKDDENKEDEAEQK